MLHRDGIAKPTSGDEIWTPPDGKPHFVPKAKSVIWLFMQGGASQMETFDPKPALNKYGGMTINETPYKHVLDSKYNKNTISKNRTFFPTTLHASPLHVLRNTRVGPIADRAAPVW